MRSHPVALARPFALLVSLAALGVPIGAGCGGSVSRGGLGSNDSGVPSNDGGATDARPGEDASPVGDAATPPDSGVEVPLYHRPNDDQCATIPPAGTCTLTMADGECTADSDCTSATNGRCAEANGGALFCSCTYDACTTDTDCAAGEVCSCHGSEYSGGQGNTCLPGNCRVDADCGTNGYCSPSVGSNDCGGLNGYYCHTASDACVNDSDCSADGVACEWSSAVSHWQCAMGLFCG